jgi:hypothetical protein
MKFTDLDHDMGSTGVTDDALAAVRRLIATQPDAATLASMLGVEL